MNTVIISQKPKHKHLTLQNYEYIVAEVTAFNASCGGKKRNTGKTEFMRNLASQVGTSLSNLYDVINDATITVRNPDLTEKTELSATAAFSIRTRSYKSSNNSKLEKAAPFIAKVENRIRENKLTTPDEAINDLKLHHQDEIEGMITICTKTYYNYVHARKVTIKPIDLPRMTRMRRRKQNYKTYIPKRQKGTSIELRPKDIETRLEFGHWEGDLVTGPRDGQNGAYLTLIERKTRFYYMIPIKRKSAKNVYMAINKLNRFYGDDFKAIFKTITFDNGSEFSRYKDIEHKPGDKEARTKVYFGRPYHSGDRGSNENCNGLIRRFIPKGTDINKIDKKRTIEINDMINKKKRKILNYLSAETVFLEDLGKLNITEHTIFYKN